LTRAWNDECGQAWGVGAGGVAVVDGVVDEVVEVLVEVPVVADEVVVETLLPDRLIALTLAGRTL
jgi:hypothetical protein